MCKIINYSLRNSHTKFLTVHFSVVAFTFSFPIRPSTHTAFFISSTLPRNHAFIHSSKEPYTHPPILSTFHPLLLPSIFTFNSTLPSSHQDVVTSCHASHITCALPHTAPFSKLPHFPSVYPLTYSSFQSTYQCKLHKTLYRKPNYLSTTT